MKPSTGDGRLATNREPKGRPKKIKQELKPQEADENDCPKVEISPVNPVSDLVRGFVARIEVQEDEKTMAQQAILDIYKQAKEQGISPHILREVIRLRQLSSHRLESYEATRNLYMQTLGLTS